MTNGGNAPQFWGPAAAAELAERYRLGLGELEKLRAALAPAFALGLQQAFENPARWPELSRLFLPGFGAARAESAGDRLLDLFFAYPGMREAVSSQAAAMSGIAPALVADMMPRLAALGTEAMMRAAMARFVPGPASGLASDDLGTMAAEMMRRGANAVEALSTPSGRSATRGPALPASPFFMFDAFGEAMRGMFGQASMPPSPVPSPRRDFDPQAPFAAMFEAFATGMRSAAEATGAAAPPLPGAGRQAERGEETAVRTPDPDLTQAFVQSGRRLQDAYVREMTALFARFTETDRAAPAKG